MCIAINDRDIGTNKNKPLINLTIRFSWIYFEFFGKIITEYKAIIHQSNDASKTGSKIEFISDRK